MPKQSEDLHSGHRERVKSKFLAHGLDSFKEHEALELLLFFALKRVDTNPIAHRLVDTFGSLDAVFSAPVEELRQVEGVGEHTALLLSLVYPLVRHARKSANERATILASTEAAGEYFKVLFLGEREERFYEACVDAKCKLLRCYQVGDGSVDSVSLNVRKVAENALKCGASGVYLSHNHPSGVALPSPDDNATTLMLYDTLRAVEVELIDHIIVADDDFVSLRDNGLLPSR